MTFLSLRKTGLPILFMIIAGCSGDSTSETTTTITSPSNERVVNGLVYGYTTKTLSGITGGQASPSRAFTSLDSGQYAINNYPAEHTTENIFYASFTDNSKLYSVWSGTPTATADIMATFHEQTVGSIYPANVNVNPDLFEARANINPITDLAYWYWLYDNRQSPYFYYQTSVFLFFKRKYSLPEQDAVHDYPSQELLQLFQEVQIKLFTDATGFSLISNTTGRTICTATFAQFPICN